MTQYETPKRMDCNKEKMTRLVDQDIKQYILTMTPKSKRTWGTYYNSVIDPDWAESEVAEQYAFAATYVDGLLVHDKTGMISWNESIRRNDIEELVEECLFQATGSSFAAFLADLVYLNGEIVCKGDLVVFDEMSVTNALPYVMRLFEEATTLQEIRILLRDESLKTIAPEGVHLWRNRGEIVIEGLGRYAEGLL